MPRKPIPLYRNRPEAEARMRALEAVVAIQADQLTMMRDRQRAYVAEIGRLKGVVECLAAEVKAGCPAGGS